MVNSSELSEVFIDVHDLSVNRELDFFRYRTFRDSFVRFFSLQRARIPRTHAVLKQISFQVRRGDRLGILGPNGAGKSTLCRCIAQLMPYDAGSIRTVGRVRAIFETQLAVQPELTGRENGHFLGDFLYPQLERRAKRRLVEEALEFSGLGEFLDVPFKTYSYGMQTRLGLSILSSAPSEILILDEVFQGADRGFQQRITERFHHIMRSSGAVLFVSHSPYEVREVCNRILVLHEGRIAYLGEIETGIETYERLCADKERSPVAEDSRAAAAWV